MCVRARSPLCSNVIGMMEDKRRLHAVEGRRASRLFIADTSGRRRLRKYGRMKKGLWLVVFATPPTNKLPPLHPAFRTENSAVTSSLRRHPRHRQIVQHAPKCKFPQLFLPSTRHCHSNILRPRNVERLAICLTRNLLLDCALPSTTSRALRHFSHSSFHPLHISLVSTPPLLQHTPSPAFAMYPASALTRLPTPSRGWSGPGLPAPTPSPSRATKDEEK